MKKFVSIVIAHIVFSLAMCILASAVFCSVPELISGTSAKYILIRAVGFFLKLFPAAISAGFLVGVSASFGSISGGAVKKFAIVIMTSLVCVFLVFFSGEVMLPVAQNARSIAENSPKIYRTFVENGNKSFQDGRMDTALRYAMEALAINPNGEDAVKLRENAISFGNAAVDLPRETIVEEKTEKQENAVPPDVNYTWNEISEKNAESLLEKSEAAENEGKWIDAHYFALLAAATAEKDSMIQKKAKAQAAHYWNLLREPGEAVNTPEMLLYREKMKAYAMMTNGDNVGAYFKYLDILKTNDLARDDSDIKKYLKIVTERIEKSCFFIDEIENIRRFENLKNIRFSIPKKDGSFDVVFVRGSAPMFEKGREVQYLRSVSIFSYEKDGGFSRSIFAPYAKLIFEPADKFTSEERENLKIDASLKTVPFLFLHGVDSRVKGREYRAEFTFSGENCEIPETIVLPIEKSDYEIFCAASAGERRLSPGALLSLFKRANSFGYASETFGAQLLHNILYPLGLLVFFIFLAKIAWNNRVEEGAVFKFKWIFILPILTVIFYIVFDILNYAIRAISFAFVASFGLYAVAGVFCLGIVALLYVSTSFLLHAKE